MKSSNDNAVHIRIGRLHLAHRYPDLSFDESLSIAGSCLEFAQDELAEAREELLGRPLDGSQIEDRLLAALRDITTALVDLRNLKVIK